MLEQWQAERMSDAVSTFERHRADLIRQRRTMNLIFIAGFLAVLAASIYISRFYPERLASGLPRIFDYFGTIMPNLEFEKLFEPRGADGRAVPLSLIHI